MAPSEFFVGTDLHFDATTPVSARLQWLLDDLTKGEGLGISELDYLVISGDFTDRGQPEGFDRAYEFVSELTDRFALSAERCILVPGNHDTKDLVEAFETRETATGEKVVVQTEKYALRFQSFSDALYHKFLQRPYPSQYTVLGIAIPFWETGIQFLTLNSCWQIDKYNRKRSGINPEAVANVIQEADKQEASARAAGQIGERQAVFRIAVWHHAVVGPEQMKDTEFLEHLRNNRVAIALHGDVHELRRDLVNYWHPRKLHIVGAGSFGARAADRAESIPRLYNLLQIDRRFRSVRIHTRCQPKADGPWKGWNEWPPAAGREGAVAYYDVSW